MTDNPTRMHRQVRVRAYTSYDPHTVREITIHVPPGGTVEEATFEQLPQYGLEIARRYLVVEVLDELDPIPFIGD